MTNNIEFEITKFQSMPNIIRDSWKKLFKTSFKLSTRQLENIILKYTYNDNLICLAFKEKKLAASYSVLLFKNEKINIALSVDTFSSGLIRNATYQSAKYLYQYLIINKKADVVCGLPNSKILNLRKKLLQWNFEKKLNYYISFYFIWKINLNFNIFKIWEVKRPKGFFFNTKLKFFSIQLQNKVYGFSPIILSLQSQKPGLMYFKIPYWIIKPRYFGYLFLTDSKYKKDFFLKNIKFLNFSSIDIP